MNSSKERSAWSLYGKRCGCKCGCKVALLLLTLKVKGRPSRGNPNDGPTGWAGLKRKGEVIDLRDDKIRPERSPWEDSFAWIVLSVVVSDEGQRCADQQIESESGATARLCASKSGKKRSRKDEYLLVSCTQRQNRTTSACRRRRRGSVSGSVVDCGKKKVGG